MSKKFIIAVIVAFVMFSGLGYLVHGYILADAYGRYPNL
jgi:peptidoglycan hydrolase CwlO-like protein